VPDDLVDQERRGGEHPVQGGTVGRCAGFVPDDLDGSTFTQAYCRLRPTYT
jgi:hypothetical protein